MPISIPALRIVVLSISLLFCIAPPVLAAPSPGPNACAANLQSRQLDFWLGDWKVTAPGSSPNAASRVYLALDKCAVIESWDGGRGHRGQNIFAYSADDGAWHGMFLDNEGRMHILNGALDADGAVVFTGPSRAPDGHKVLNRVRIVSVGPNEVRQISQKSSDNGASWSAEYSGDYTRKPTAR